MVSQALRLSWQEICTRRGDAKSLFTVYGIPNLYFLREKFSRVASKQVQQQVPQEVAIA